MHEEGAIPQVGLSTKSQIPSRMMGLWATKMVSSSSVPSDRTKAGPRRQPAESIRKPARQRGDVVVAMNQLLRAAIIRSRSTLG